MKRLLIITDSLGLPRPVPETVNYNETWCSLLRSHFEIHQFSYGGGTIGDLLSQIAYLKMFDPDVVVVQSGIVDCSPRALSRYENYLINKYRLSKKLMGWLGPRFIRLLRKRGITYTAINDFQRSIATFKATFGEKLYWVGIIPASSDYEKKIKGIADNIDQYNDIIKREMKDHFIDLSDIVPDGVMSDFHHLNVIGHKKLARKVVELMK